MSPTSWVLIIHERDYHIPTIQLDAKSRKPLFMVVEKVFLFESFHFKELVGHTITSIIVYIVFDERKRTNNKIIGTINIRDASIAVLDPKVFS